jgi:hypothetical protein
MPCRIQNFEQSFAVVLFFLSQPLQRFLQGVVSGLAVQARNIFAQCDNIFVEKLCHERSTQ